MNLREKRKLRGICSQQKINCMGANRKPLTLCLLQLKVLKVFFQFPWALILLVISQLCHNFNAIGSSVCPYCTVLIQTHKNAPKTEDCAILIRNVGQQDDRLGIMMFPCEQLIIEIRLHRLLTSVAHHSCEGKVSNEASQDTPQWQTLLSGSMKPQRRTTKDYIQHQAAFGKGHPSVPASPT